MSETHDFEERGFLRRLGVYGFEPVEKVVLAALVTMDPLLLIGRTGTGKTCLLNSISEAMGLEHRHYNASLISFDDLVGFPYPDEDRTSIRYMETPATIWQAESVLVDEISRCKPEHQNRLFSLVHERRIQGIRLERLRYRWAAMNPCEVDGNADYLGSEPLDQALADRFGLVVPVDDWKDFQLEDRLRIANPAGDGEKSDDGGRLKQWLAHARRRFLEIVEEFRPGVAAAGREAALAAGMPVHWQCVLEYVVAAVQGFLNAGIRVSPRRSRMLSRSLIAGYVLDGERAVEGTFRQILACSLPHAASGAPADAGKVRAIHRLAWGLAFENGDLAWIHRIHLEQDLPGKIRILLRCAPSPDTASMAVCQMLSSAPREKAAMLALALYPAAAVGKTPIGAEAVNDLGRIAQPILEVNGTVSWHPPANMPQLHHPEYTRYGEVIRRLRGKRKERARQFFYWSIVEGIVHADPRETERTLNRCIETVRKEANL